MKLSHFQLPSHLEKKLQAIYIVSGDEWLLKQDALDLIRIAAKKNGFNERIRFTPTSTADWETLYPLLYASSLFADKRYIELIIGDSMPNKAASDILIEYANAPGMHQILVLDIGRDEKITKSAWLRALDKIAMVIALWPIAHEQLPAWLIERAKKYQLQLTLPAAKLIADYVEGNLTAAQQTIEKIALLQPKQRIDADLIETLLTDESHFTVFDFIHHLLAGDATRSLHILQRLKVEDTELTLILWAITRELRMLHELSVQQSNGQSINQLFEKQRIFPRRQPVMRRFLARYSATDCLQFLLQAAQIDRAIKGSLPEDPWASLQLFCLRMVY